MIKRLTAVIAALVAAATMAGPAAAVSAHPAADAPPVECQPYLDQMQVTIDQQRTQLDRDIRIMFGDWWDNRRLEATVDRLQAEVTERDATISRQQQVIERLRHRLHHR